MRDGDRFYAYATGSAGFSNIQVATSDDLVDWSASEDALPERPDWQPVRQGLTWAPEVVEVDGGAGTGLDRRTGAEDRALGVGPQDPLRPPLGDRDDRSA